MGVCAHYTSKSAASWGGGACRVQEGPRKAEHSLQGPNGGLFLRHISFSAGHPPRPGTTKLMAPQDGALEVAGTNPAPPPRQIKDLSLAGSTQPAF